MLSVPPELRGERELRAYSWEQTEVSEPSLNLAVRPFAIKRGPPPLVSANHPPCYDPTVHAVSWRADQGTDQAKTTFVHPPMRLRSCTRRLEQHKVNK